MPNDNPFSDVQNDTVSKLVGEAVRRSKQLQAEAEEATRIQTVWESLQTYMVKGWPLHVVKLFDHELPLLKKLRTDHHPAIDTLESIYRMARDQAATLKRRFPANLEGACQASGLSIDRQSKHPRYYFAGGFFKIEVDDQQGVARLSDHEGSLDEVAADVGAIIELVQREQTRVFDRQFDGDKFLSKLRRQYVAVAKKSNQPDGASIPIRHITRRLGKNEKGFRTDEFLVDLSRLVEQGPTEVDGRRLDLQQTKDSSQGMLLIGAAGRGYVGYVIFKEVKS
jgi:hypothetical protein